MSKNTSNKKIIIYTIIYILLITLFIIIRFPKTVDIIKLNYSDENLNFIQEEQIQTTHDLKLSYDNGKGFSYFDKTKNTDILNDILPLSATTKTAIFEIYERGNKVYKTNLNTIDIGLKKLKLTLPNIDGNFEISSIVFFNGAKEVSSINAQQLSQMITPKNANMKLKGDVLRFTDIKEDSFIEINTSYNSPYNKALSHFGIPNIFLILLITIIYVFMGYRYKIFKDL